MVSPGSDQQMRSATLVLYDLGDGVEQDYAEAMKWYRLAVDQGDADAQNNIGVLYDLGRGVEQDYAEAMKWYRLAAGSGRCRCAAQHWPLI